MKKTLLIALFLIPLFGISQTTKPIEGFLGIKFGSSKAQVIAQMKAKGYTAENSGANELLFGSVLFGHRKSDLLRVVFVDNKLYEGMFFFKPQEAAVIGYYNLLVNDIAEVYGEGKPTKTYKEPYYEGDGHETSAILLGYAAYYTDWDINSNSIEAEIIGVKTNLYVGLKYIDGNLQNIADQKQKVKDKSDY